MPHLVKSSLVAIIGITFIAGEASAQYTILLQHLIHTHISLVVWAWTLGYVIMDLTLTQGLALGLSAQLLEQASEHRASGSEPIRA